jgi:hypothetical protein
LVTCRVFFKLKELFKKWWPSEDDNSIELRFNRTVYGLGHSPNEDIYIEEYRSLANEYANPSGKLTNLNMIGGASQIGNSQFNDLLSSSSTTISTSSSINSLNGQMAQNPIIANQ